MRYTIGKIVSRHAAPPPLGTLLDGRYRLQGLLGSGGMGRVYEAEDMRLGRRVAIKVLYEDDADGTMAERLFREAKAAARAEHPAVVTTYGYGVDPELGVDYVVMECLQGETLAARIERDGKLSIPFILRVGLEIAEALIAVHEAGVVHRDLKPSNVFLATRGRRIDDVKLLDFGVAKQLDLHTLTLTGQIYGTPQYMAPEQINDSKRVDRRSDIYSLGVVLYECATGELPFREKNVTALLCQIMFGAEPNVRARRADLPEPLAAAIARCLQRQAGNRYQTARSLYEALAPL